MAFLPLFISVFLVSQVVAANALGPIKSRQTLFPRQGLNGGALPPQCMSTCAILNTLDACKDPICYCTSDNNQALAICVDCIINVNPSAAIIASGQNLLNQYATNCFDDGITLPTAQVSSFPLTASGTSTSATLFSSATIANSTTAAASTSAAPTLTGTPTPTGATTLSVPGLSTTTRTAASSTTSALNPTKTGGAICGWSGATGMLYNVAAAMGVVYVMV